MKTHYRLPLDEEFDADVINWINTFPSDKKGEMVRHAIRYYMQLEGTKIGFPKLNTVIANEPTQAHMARLDDYEEEFEETEYIEPKQELEPVEEAPKEPKKRPKFTL